MTGMLLRLAYGLQTGIALLSERDDARGDRVTRERGRDFSDAFVGDALEDPVACALSTARDGVPLGERMDCGLLLAGLGSRASCWRDAGMTTLLRRFISV